MTFDRNPKPVQFIQPKLLDRACLSVGKDDGFADQFGLRLAVLIQNITHGPSPMALFIHARPSRLWLNGEAFSSARRWERLTVSLPPIRGAGEFAF